MIRPQVAISGCLLGERVRYDGNHKRSSIVADVLVDYVDTISLCPEVGSGMPIPRPPIQLVKTSTGLQLQEVASPTRDHSTKMRHFVSKIIDQYPYLAGMVAKSKSPSCGVTDTPVVNADRANTYGSGYFIRLLKRELPYLSFIDESYFEHQDYRHRFLLHCFTLARFFHQYRQNGLNGVRSFHYQHQLLFEALHPKKSAELKSTLELWNNHKATQIHYLTKLADLLQMPFNSDSVFVALDKFTTNQDVALKSVLRLIQKSLHQTDQEQWISALFYTHLSELTERFNHPALIENPFFNPYPVCLLNAEKQSLFG
jgi:uncharacterized protein YbbK (DUF523 family)